MAKDRGLSAAEVARKLRLYPSNLSAMDAGTRTVSLRLLTRIAKFLSCSPADLVEVTPENEMPLFRNMRTLRRLQERIALTPDGTERGWVHTLLFAWQRHYRSAQTTK